MKISNLDKVINKDFQADFIIFDLGISTLQIFNLDRASLLIQMTRLI